MAWADRVWMPYEQQLFDESRTDLGCADAMAALEDDALVDAFAGWSVAGISPVFEEGAECRRAQAYAALAFYCAHEEKDQENYTELLRRCVGSGCASLQRGFGSVAFSCRACLCFDDATKGRRIWLNDVMDRYIVRRVDRSP